MKSDENLEIEPNREPTESEDLAPNEGDNTGGRRARVSRRSALVLLGLGGVGVLSRPVTATGQGPRWARDVDANGHRLFDLGALATRANSTDITDFAGANLTIDGAGVLRADKWDTDVDAAGRSLTGIGTLEAGTASFTNLGAAVAMTERQAFDGTEPEPWIEWNQVDFEHADVVTYDEATFTIQRDGIYDLRIVVTLLSVFQNNEPRSSAFAEVQVLRLPGLSDVLMRGSEYSDVTDIGLQRTITLTRVLPLSVGDQIGAQLIAVSNNRQVIGSDGFPSYMSITRLG